MNNVVISMKAAFHRFVTTVGNALIGLIENTKACIIYITERNVNIEVNAKRIDLWIEEEVR